MVIVVIIPQEIRYILFTSIMISPFIWFWDNSTPVLDFCQGRVYEKGKVGVFRLISDCFDY